MDYRDEEILKAKRKENRMKREKKMQKHRKQRHKNQFMMKKFILWDMKQSLPGVM